jgi:GAF domain-containing protein
MRRRSRAGGEPVKTRRRKTATLKRRNVSKVAHLRESSAAGLSKKVALFKRERDEALEQQRATSEVLRVISGSPGELEPVFQTMLANAVRICDAKFGILFRYDNEAYDPVALFRLPPALVEFLRHRGSFQPVPGSMLDRVRQTKVYHTADYAAEAVHGRAVELGGARSTVAVPMLKDGALIGAIVIYRQEVRPFTDKQIALVQNFAAQAVIAIENTRLLNELRESLQQQTATSEVLGVISSSPGELAPVFQTVLANATRICEAKFGTLFRYEGELFHRVAGVGTPPALVEFQEKRGPFKPVRHLSRLLQTKAVYHTADELSEPDPSPPGKYGGARSVLNVPMLKDNEVVGAIVIYRQEVRPFSDKQIELVKNFAAQAVIAIENTRLLNELRQSLQQQTATADVLKTISRSTFDLQTVLDTLVQSAARLCRADRSGIRLARKDGLYHHVASLGFSPEHKARLEKEPLKPDEGSMVGRVVLRGKSVHLVDSQADPHRELANRSRSGNIHTLLGVPLQREGTPIGVLLLQRTVVQPFTDKEIALAETFADQAVIAIENVRLFEVLVRTLPTSCAVGLCRRRHPLGRRRIERAAKATRPLPLVRQTVMCEPARKCQKEWSFEPPMCTVDHDQLHLSVQSGLCAWRSAPEQQIAIQRQGEWCLSPCHKLRPLPLSRRDQRPCSDEQMVESVPSPWIPSPGPRHRF